MATRERIKTTNEVLRMVWILAVGASLTLASCGTSQVLSETVPTTADRQSVLRDPDNPYWSRNTAVFEMGERRSVLMDPDNPHWSRNTVAPEASGVVDQRGRRPH